MRSPDQQIAALKHELAGYVAAGMDERAAQVRAEIARAGGELIETAEAAAPQETRVRKAPRKRA